MGMWAEIERMQLLGNSIDDMNENWNGLGDMICFIWVKIGMD